MAFEKNAYQKAYQHFKVRCRKCASLNVEWINTLGYSQESGIWGEAGFKCRNCGAQTDMIES